MDGIDEFIKDNISLDQTQIRIYSNEMEKLIREFQNSDPEPVIQFIYQELERMKLTHTIASIEEESKIKKKQIETGNIMENSVFIKELDNIIDGISEDIKNTPIRVPTHTTNDVGAKSLSQLLEQFMQSDDELFLRCFVSCFTLFISHEELIEEIATNLEKCFFLGMKISYWIGSYEDLIFDNRIKDQFEKLLYCLEKTGKLDLESCETIRMMLNGLITVGGMSKILLYASDTFDMLEANTDFYEIPNVEIARQITLQDQTMLLSLKSQDLYLIDTCWEATSIINRYSNLKGWSGNLVGDKTQLRTKELEKLISIAENLKLFNNYWSLFAILEGISTVLDALKDTRIIPDFLLKRLNMLKKTRFKMVKARFLDCPTIPF